MKPKPDPHYRRRFPAKIISHAVWLYHVFSLSLRDVEPIMAERVVVVSYETVRRWCKKFAAGIVTITWGGRRGGKFQRALRRLCCILGDSFLMPEIEGVRPDLAIVRGWQLVSAGTEVAVIE